MPKKIKAEAVHKILITKFGPRKRINKTISEMSELGTELKDNLNGANNLEDITEEIADVENMLDDMKILFKIDQSRINDIKSDKLKRTLKRIQYDS